MTRRKQNFIVGNKNVEKKDMYKPLISLCLSIQKEINEENSKKGIKKKVPFIYAQVELFRRINDKKYNEKVTQDILTPQTTSIKETKTIRGLPQ